MQKKICEGYIRQELKERGLLNDRLENLVNSISFEELMVLKMELTALHMPRYFSIKNNRSFIHDLLASALFHFVVVNELSSVQAAKFLGVKRSDLAHQMERYNQALDNAGEPVYTKHTGASKSYSASLVYTDNTEEVEDIEEEYNTEED